MQFDAIKSLVKEDFQAVDQLIVSSLHSKASIINDLGHYIIQGGGKRLRPLVVLLVAKACSYAGKDHIPMATLIELIHTATLLHDDVVDEAELRRGRQTANTIWGNVASVLVGDFLYSKAFQILTDILHPKVMKVIADTANTMAEGEALQLLDRHNPVTTEGAYLNVIRSKTAKLFEAAALLGAILSGASPALENAMGLYGMHLGTAFQLIDDVMDYSGSSAMSGKKLGNDLIQGKMTLPLIYVLQNGNDPEIKLIQTVIKEGNGEAFEEVRKIIEARGGIEYTLKCASIEVERAEKTLSELPESEYKEALKSLARYSLERRN